MAADESTRFGDLCRLCATKTNTILGINIFENEGAIRQINKKIETCLTIQVHEADELPKMICENCVYKLEVFYEFRERSLRTENLLIDLFKELSSVKPPTTINKIPHHLNINSLSHSDIILIHNNDLLNQQSLQNIDLSQLDHREIMLDQHNGDISAHSLNLDLNHTDLTGHELSNQSLNGQESLVVSTAADLHLLNQQRYMDDSLNLIHSDQQFIAEQYILHQDLHGTSNTHDLSEVQTHDINDMQTHSQIHNAVNSASQFKEEIFEDSKLTFNQISNSQIIPENVQNVLVQKEKNMTLHDKSSSQHDSIMANTNLQQKLNNINFINCDNLSKTNFVSENVSEPVNASSILKDRLLVNERVKNSIQQDILTIPQKIENFSDPETSQEAQEFHSNQSDTSETVFECNICHKQFRDKEEFENCSKGLCSKGHANTRGYGSESSQKNVQVKSEKKLKSLEKLSNGDVLKKEVSRSETEDSSKEGNAVDDEEQSEACSPANTAKRKQLSSKECKECGKIYKTNYKLREHMRKHTGEKPYKCSSCDKAFRSKIGLSQHEAKHTGNYELRCATCGKGFQCKSYLMVHQRVHSDIKPYPCTTCGGQFKTKQSLLDHTNRHLGVKPYTCEICGKSFITKGLCRAHLKTHCGLDNRKYLCSVCNKRFVSKSYLQTHLKIHTGEKPYICQFCNKGFLTRGDLRIHSTMHTGEKSYVCEICGKAFARRDALRCHKRCHTGERPYSCEICGQTFTQFSPMAIHKRLHTGERPYPCEICGKTFVSRSIMMCHFKKHAKT